MGIYTRNNNRKRLGIWSREQGAGRREQGGGAWKKARMQNATEPRHWLREV
jgi:hypothetical protein